MLGLCVTFLLLGLVIVVAGGFLARCADRIADGSGLGQTLAGLLLLAGATSLPELSVGVSAVRMGAIDLTVGELIGSSLFNLLILAILDLVTRTRGQMLSKTAASHALSATSSIVMTAVVLLFLLAKADVVFLRMGIGSWVLMATYALSLRLVFFDQQTVLVPQGPDAERPKIPLSPAITGYVVAASAIFLAAPRLAQTAEALATATGLGQSFFGTVFVASMTSLPEAVTTFSAIRWGTVEMAVGNVFGSNAFNMIILALCDVAIPGSLLAAADPVHAITATTVILTTSVAILGLLYRAEKRWWIVEPDALLVALLVIGAFLMLAYQ